MGTILFKKIPFWVSFLSVGAVIYDLGFDQDAWMAKVLLILYAVNLQLPIGVGKIELYFDDSIDEDGTNWGA